MRKVVSCLFNMDTACIDVIYESGGTLSIYTPMIEESLRTTIQSRTKLDWLIDNEPLEYAKMVFDGTMQDYLDMIDGNAQQQRKTYAGKLTEHYPSNIAEDIAREMMMYNS